MAVFPTTTPTTTPDSTDQFLFADTSDSNQLKKSTAPGVVQAGVSGIDSDDVAEGNSNLYMTTGERAKLATVQAGAEPNAVTSVNGQVLGVVLDQDDIPSGATFVQTNNNFTDTDVSNLNDNSIHRNRLDNPHQVDNVQVGLGNVTNDTQLSQTAGNFDNVPEKSNIQLHLEDKYVLQDSADGDQIKHITNQTDLIWKASLIQVWGPSINYYNFTFTDNTTYNINSIVVNGTNIYMCLVDHQSTGSFAADLAAGFWMQIGGGGGGGGGNLLTSGSGSPVTPGVNQGDVFVDYDNGVVYYRDGATWGTVAVVMETTTGSPAGAGSVVGETRVDPADGNIYVWDGANWVVNQATNPSPAGVQYVTSPTTGDRLVFSSGTGANLIDESVIGYNSATTTLDMGGVNTTGTQNFNASYVGDYNGSTINLDGTTTNYENTNTNNLPNGATIVNNLDGDVDNNYGATYTEDNTYTAGATINNDGDLITNNNNFTEIINNTNSTQDINGGTINYDNVEENYNDTPVQISCQATPAFSTAYTAPIDTQYAEVKLEYDNGVDPVVSKTIQTLYNGASQIFDFVTPSDIGTVSVSWSTGDITVSVIQGSTFTFDATEGLCYYNGVSQQNNTNNIINNNGTITENANTTTNNTGVTEVYDSNSTTVHNGTATFENIQVTNIEVQPGAIQFVPTVPVANVTGVYPLAYKPSFVYKNGLYMLEGVGNDYVYDDVANEVQFTSATIASDIIVFI